MPIAVTDISQEQVQLVLSRSEGQFCDMKAKEITPAKLSRTLSALTNTDGGEVFVGVATTANREFQWIGFQDEEAANAHIQQIDYLFPIGNITTCGFLRAKGQPGLVLHVEVAKSREIRLASDGKPYVRRGAQNLPVTTAEQLERLNLDKGLHSFEDHTLQALPAEISNSVAVLNFMYQVVPSAEPEPWLEKQKLIVNGKPVVAGALLYADEPQTLLPKASIKIYRYKTNDLVGTRATLAFDPKAIEGNAYNQIFEAVGAIKGIIEEIPVLGQEGLEKISFPTEAVHEILTNAVIHRDYSIQDDVHVRIFDNRIEIESPGKLPGHVTVQNILDERSARNPKIVRLLNKFKNPPNKDVGEGLNTAFEAMRGLKLREPIIQQRDNSVLVTLRHEKLGTPEEIIVDYLRAHDEINNTIARQICFIGSENSVKRVFQKMLGSKLIERVPGRPLNKTGYVKGPNFPK